MLWPPPSQVSERLRESLKKWAEGEFKGDSQLSLIPALYTKLKQDGYDFNVQSDSVSKFLYVYFGSRKTIMFSFKAILLPSADC